MGNQPFLHDLEVQVAAPTQVWSGADGEIRAATAARPGAQGVYHGDVRVLSLAFLEVSDASVETVSVAEDDDGLRIVQLARVPDAPGADPVLRLDRLRSVHPGVVAETVEVSRGDEVSVSVGLTLRVACDGAPVYAVKAGDAGTPVDPEVREDQGDVAASWSTAGVVVELRAPGARTAQTDGALALRWDLDPAPHRPAHAHWSVTVSDPASPLRAPRRRDPEWSVPVVVSPDRRIAALLDRSLRDLAGLRMSVADGEDVFLAAGAPWFLTLFGRDSIWAARMLLPLGTDLAAGTLRALARLQGAAIDVDRAEEPGKILHELRRGDQQHGQGLRLPPRYYGTVDATPLWLVLLHDAWRWGMPAAEVEALLDHAEAALDWMDRFGDADGDGLLEYVDASGHGLANQGWKDSDDSVQWRDGRLAQGPIALAEVQGYAVEAARAGAALLDAFGRPGASRWLQWADRLVGRFRESFWVAGTDGPYPAIALDAAKHPVDTLTSNIGHLLGTGILDTEEEAEVVARLASPALDSGYGLRTMATDSSGYWPLRYHGGTVWPHDTAIGMLGMHRAGYGTEAARLAEGLLAAGAELGYRLPELYAGDARGTRAAVVPYPAACRPQAWSAASAVALLTVLLGLRADVPGGTVRLEPAAGPHVLPLSVNGLRVAGAALDVSVDGSGTRAATAAEVRIETSGG